MTKYIIKRILIAIPVLIGITIIDYAIMCLAGSPLEMLKGPRVSEAAVEAKKIAMGLDKPFYIQYFVWLSQLLHGNMGKVLPAGFGNDQKPSGTDPPADGSFPGREPDPCSAGRYLQCDPPVFQRGLCSSDCFLPWKQYTGIFPVTAPYLYFYDQA